MNRKIMQYRIPTLSLLLGIVMFPFCYAEDIIITRPAEYNGTGPAQFVIQDRNVGATSNDISSPDSYGYHFQRGNNHGFSNNGDITIIDTQVDASEYGPNNPYSGDAFIKRQSSPYDWSSVKNDNLRGGSGDSASNNRGLDDIETTAVNRQGPCDEGYHVPSAGEWSKVFEYWCLNNSDKCSMSNMKLSNGLYYNYSDPRIGDNFRSELKIPFAGNRYYYDGSWSDAEYYASLRSSSPSGDRARFLSLDSSNVYANNLNLRAFGFSVRCFKNSPSLSNSSILSLSAMSGSMVATGEVKFDEGTHLTYGTQVINVIERIKNALLLSEKYFIERYKTNSQGEQEKVDIENLDITETTSLSGTVKKQNLCKQPQYYHGVLN